MNQFREKLDKLGISYTDLAEMTGEKVSTMNSYYYGKSQARPIFLAYLDQLENGACKLPEKVVEWCRDQLAKHRKIDDAKAGKDACVCDACKLARKILILL